MIRISELTKDHIGKWVIYDDGFEKPEKGKIKSWNDEYIFVVYDRPGRDMSKFFSYTGVATKPEDLNFCL